MRELIGQKTFDKDGLLNYLKNLKEEASSNDGKWAYGNKWVDTFNLAIKEIETNKPIDEYYIKIFKEVNDNGYVSYDMSMTVGRD